MPIGYSQVYDSFMPLLVDGTWRESPTINLINKFYRECPEDRQKLLDYAISCKESGIRIGKADFERWLESLA